MRNATLRRYFRHGIFTQLMVFEAVARLGSLTRASEELHLAQPTVSVQMKKLSESMGVKLLRMSGRGVELTDAGRELLACCWEISGALGNLEERLAPLRPAKDIAIPILAPPPEA
ncbi:MAG: LysR family transcriptional regulator [Proteobacteria bacterium]|nr:LysR family transcriptional regulator [Pseudomonadota bacterium]